MLVFGEPLCYVRTYGVAWVRLSEASTPGPTAGEQKDCLYYKTKGTVQTEHGRRVYPPPPPPHPHTYSATGRPPPTDPRTHLSWQLAHDGERGHVERDPGAGLERRLVQLVAAPHHVPRPAGCFHDEPVVVKLLQHVADYLSDALFGFGFGLVWFVFAGGKNRTWKRSDTEGTTAAAERAAARFSEGKERKGETLDIKHRSIYILRMYIVCASQGCLGGKRGGSTGGRGGYTSWTKLLTTTLTSRGNSWKAKCRSYIQQLLVQRLGHNTATWNSLQTHRVRLIRCVLPEGAAGLFSQQWQCCRNYFRRRNGTDEHERNYFRRQNGNTDEHEPDPKAHDN